MKKIKILLVLILLILSVFIFDYIYPVKVVKIEQTNETDISLPEGLNSYFISYNIYTSFSKFSTADRLDVLEGMEKNKISASLITDCTEESKSLEGIYKNKTLISSCSAEESLINFTGLSIVPFGKKVDDLKENQCKEIVNLTKSLEFNVVNIPRI